jgi:hypothetical protein
MTREEPANSVHAVVVFPRRRPSLVFGSCFERISARIAQEKVVDNDSRNTACGNAPVQLFDFGR